MEKKTFLLFIFFTFLADNSCAISQLKLTAIEGSLNSKISQLVLEEAYKKLNIEIDIIALPGERALRTSNSGKVDGELFRIANIEKRYKNLVVVPTPINVLQGIAFTKNLRPSIEGWDSLKPFKIGIQVGIKFAERGTQEMNPILVDTNEQLFKMLDNERLDIIIAAMANGLKTMHKLKLESIHPIQPPIQEYPLYHYLHKKHLSLVPQIDKVLQDMHKTGRTQTIRNEVLLSGKF